MSDTTCVIYVHGFGGEDASPPFYKSMCSFFQGHDLQIEAQAFSWPSLPITIETVIHNFVKSQKEAEDAGQLLSKRLTDMERLEISYHLVGFSLGTEVIRHALSCITNPLSRLKSIYLMGAAFNLDAEINESILPITGRYHNYYSDNDYVLKLSYFNVTGSYAAGSVGVKTGTRFSNYRTQCSHTLAYNYQMLAQPICYLIAWDEKQYIPGKSKINISLPTAGGNTFWHTICVYKKHIVQQNMNTGHFRALSDTPAKLRKAWGSNLHAILSQL